MAEKVNVLGLLNAINNAAINNIPGYGDKVNAATEKLKTNVVPIVQPVVDDVAKNAVTSALKKYWWAIALIPVVIIGVILITKNKKRR